MNILNLHVPPRFDVRLRITLLITRSIYFCNLRLIKVNSNLEITWLIHLKCCYKIWIGQPIIHILHIQLIHSPAIFSYNQSINITEVFYKKSRLGFSFGPLISFEIIQCRFSKWDFHLSSYRMTQKSDIYILLAK